MVCIFPKDETTDFLLPLYDKLCSLGFKGLHVDTNDNIELVLEAIGKAKVVVFLDMVHHILLWALHLMGIRQISFTKIIFLFLRIKGCFCCHVGRQNFAKLIICIHPLALE